MNTHKHGIELLHSVDAIKSTIGMQSAKVKTILERLFRRGGSSYKKLLLLDISEFYAFIINNEHRLKEEFREVTAGDEYADDSSSQSEEDQSSIFRSRTSISTTRV